MVSIRVLSSRVVAPNVDVPNALNWHLLSLGKDRLSTRLVETGQGSEVLLGDAGSEVRRDQSVSVGWVADNTHLHSLLGDFVKSLSLSLEDLCVSLKEVSTLHTGTAWSGSNEHGHISVFESNEWVSGGDNLVHEVVGAIIELHNETLQDFLSGWQLKELKDNLLVGSKHAALSNEVAEEGSDGSSGTGDGNTDRFFGVLGWREMSSNALKAFH